MELRKETLKISGMHCNSCVNRITKGLFELEGIEEINVNRDTETATFVLNLEVNNLNIVRDTIEDLGYQVVENTAEKEATSKSCCMTNKK